MTELPALSVEHKKVSAPNPRFSALDALKTSYEVKGQHTDKIDISKQDADPPLVLQSFAGQNPNGTPLDNSIAVSKSGWILSAVNTNIRVFDSSGNSTFIRTLAAIANSLGTLNRTFDPHVLFDPEQERFVLMFLNGSSSENTSLIIGFSETDDPRGFWNFYRLPGNVKDKKWWSDYPFMSLSRTHLLISVLLWEDGEEGWDVDAEDENLWLVGLKEAYNGDSLKVSMLNELSYAGKQLWDSRPVRGGDQLYDDHLLICNRPKDALNDSIFIIQIEGEAGNPITAKIRALKATQSYGLQSNVTQLGGKKLRTNYCDIHSAYRFNKNLYFASNTMVSGNGRPGLFVGKIEDYINADVVQAQIIASDSLDLCYPSIAYAGGGWPDESAVVLCLQNSRASYPGCAVIRFDRDFNPSSPLTLKRGEGMMDVMADSLERWGDYTGAHTWFGHPGKVWVAGSFGRVNGGSQTWISLIANPDEKLTVKEVSNNPNAMVFPNPGRVARLKYEGLSGDCDLSITSAMGQIIFKSSFIPELGAGEIALYIPNEYKGFVVINIYDKQNARLVFTQKLLLID